MFSSSNYDLVEETCAISKWAPRLRGHLGSPGFNILGVLDFPQVFRSFDSVTSVPRQSLSLELRYGQALALSVPEKPLFLGQALGKYIESRHRQAVSLPNCPTHKRWFGVTKFSSSFVSPLMPSPFQMTNTWAFSCPSEVHRAFWPGNSVSGSKCLLGNPLLSRSH